MVVERSGRAWRRLRAASGTVRVRLTVGAVTVVAAALVVGAVAMVVVLRETLASGVRITADLRAEVVAEALASSAGPAALAVSEPDEVFIQVLDPGGAGEGRGGAVVAASSNVAGLPAFAALRPGESTEVDTSLASSRFVAVAVGADTPDGRRTIVVGRSLTDTDESDRAVIGLLAAGLPALLLVVGLTTWMVVGRALAPVGAIRAEVDEISDSQLHRRVPQPPGGDEIARLAITMNRMLARLDDSQARRRRFTSDASHELRSPVASIREHTEIALAHPGRTTVVELAETVLAENTRVQDLVEDLLMLATADEDGLRPGPDRVVDLDDIVFEHAEILRAGTGLRIDTSAVSGGRIRGDAVRLRRAVRNLADNAARHARTLVAISLRERDGMIVLQVDDDGAGIPLARRQDVFERFVRLDEARTRDEGGTGLGLAIVAEIVAAHGGTVEAAERPGGGNRFELRFPALPD